MDTTTFTVGQRIQFTNRKGRVLTGEVIDVYPANAYPFPAVRVRWSDHREQAMKIADLVAVN